MTMIEPYIAIYDAHQQIAKKGLFGEGDKLHLWHKPPNPDSETSQ